MYENNIGVLVPTILLPPAGTDFSKWAVVACDQYTSQPEYWREARRIVGSAPSALDLILPETFLGMPDEAERIAEIHNNMQRYLATGLLRQLPQGFVLVSRTTESGERTGLILALDLECYDFRRGSTTLIRATEGTIEERIPPRLKIRANAPLELPHILVLIDDPRRTVIEPLLKKAAALPLLYDTDLMLGGGHVHGRLVSDPVDIRAVLDALAALTDPETFRALYGEHAPLLFAMGDGNHSLATAKANWERIKPTLSEAEQQTHPARFALAEIENVHDTGIFFEPIHRVVFGLGGKAGIEALRNVLLAQNASVTVEYGVNKPAAGGETHVLPFQTGTLVGTITVSAPTHRLAVGTLQNAIDALLSSIPNAEVDYIHGEDVVRALAAAPDAMGFWLPPMEKSDLFPTVVFDGALPRKTFSMGEAHEKRFYLECRRLDR